MATLTLGSFELSVGVVIGLILFGIVNNVGAVITKVYFEPWLINFKSKHDKALKEIKDGINGHTDQGEARQ